MGDMAYLAAGLRVFCMVAVPITLIVYACVAVGAASERKQEQGHEHWQGYRQGQEHAHAKKHHKK